MKPLYESDVVRMKSFTLFKRLAVFIAIAQDPATPIYQWCWGIQEDENKQRIFLFSLSKVTQKKGNDELTFLSIHLGPILIAFGII